MPELLVRRKKRILNLNEQVDGEPRLAGIHTLVIEAEQAQHREIERVLTALANVRSLRNLTVRSTGLLPRTVMALTQLHALRIVDSEAQLPTELGNLTRLRSLDLDMLGLRNVPKSIGRLDKLRNFSVRSHRLERVPAVFGRLEELRSVSFSFLSQTVRRSQHENYYRPCFEQSLAELFELLSALPQLDEVSLSNPFGPRNAQPRRDVLEVPPELNLLRSLAVLRIANAGRLVELPIRHPNFPKLDQLIASRTQFVHSNDELIAALPNAYISIGFGQEAFRHGTNPTSVCVAECPGCETTGLRLLKAKDYEVDVDQLACLTCGGMFPASMLVPSDA